MVVALTNERNVVWNLQALALDVTQRSDVFTPVETNDCRGSLDGEGAVKTLVVGIDSVGFGCGTVELGNEVKPRVDQFFADGCFQRCGKARGAAGQGEGDVAVTESDQFVHGFLQHQIGGNADHWHAVVSNCST